jgi:opacity protein-like surface antigen
MRTLIKTTLLSLLLTGTASATFAADLIVEPPMMTTPAPVSSWDGFYLGGHIGYGFGMADHQPVAPPPGFPNGYDISLGGPIVGGQIGGLFHLSDQFVGGIQLDGDWANVTGTLDTGGFPGTLTYTVNWLATVEGRLGYDAGQFLPYVAGGIAVANATRSSSGTGTSSSATHTGFSFGAGMMMQVTDNLTADVEVRDQIFGPQTYTTGGTPPSIALNVASIRAGLNFHF